MTKNVQEAELCDRKEANLRSDWITVEKEMLEQ